MTIEDLERDVYNTSKYQQIKKQCLLKIASQELALDKFRIKDVVLSLRNANRELLKQNGISEASDDFIYLTVVMRDAILK